MKVNPKVSSNGIKKVLQTTETAAPAVDRALDILELVAASPEGLTLTQISDKLGFPKNAVFRISQVLQRRGYLERDPQALTFHLTNRFFELSQSSGSGKTLIEVALPEMRKLRDICRETVQLGVRCGEGGVILEKLESLHPLRISVDVGLRFPLHNNAPGKILLAYLPSQERNHLIQTLDLFSSTARTITNRDNLATECSLVVQRGYAMDIGEADEGIHCLAAPIFHRHQQLVATVWISAPARRLPKDNFPAQAQIVQQTAQAIGRGLQK